MERAEREGFMVAKEVAEAQEARDGARDFDAGRGELERYSPSMAETSPITGSETLSGYD